MKGNRNSSRLVMTVLIFTLLAAASVGAADFPSRPIMLINPMAPGGTLDLQARAFAALGEKLLGQPVVVTNKPGATGMIALVEVANATSDGHTLFVGAKWGFSGSRMGNRKRSQTCCDWSRL